MLSSTPAPVWACVPLTLGKTTRHKAVQPATRNLRIHLPEVPDKTLAAACRAKTLHISKFNGGGADLRIVQDAAQHEYSWYVQH